MSRTVKTNWNGKEYDATPVDVVSSSEHFNIYTLDDGTLLKTRSVLIGVIRIPGQYDTEGNPIYQIKQHQMVVAEAPASLKKKQQG